MNTNLFKSWYVDSIIVNNKNKTLTFKCRCNEDDVIYTLTNLKLYNKFIPSFLIRKKNKNSFIIQFLEPTGCIYGETNFNDCVLIDRNYDLDYNETKLLLINLTFKYKKSKSRHIKFDILPRLKTMGFLAQT